MVSQQVLNKRKHQRIKFSSVSPQALDMLISSQIPFPLEPFDSGIYFLYEKDSIVYIGKSKNILARVGQHLSLPRYKNVTKVTYFKYKKDLDYIEYLLIKLFSPKYNSQISRYEKSPHIAEISDKIINDYLALHRS